MRLINGLWTQIDDGNNLGQVMRLRIVISAKRDYLEAIKHLILEVNYLALIKQIGGKMKKVKMLTWSTTWAGQGRKKKEKKNVFIMARQKNKEVWQE